MLHENKIKKMKQHMSSACEIHEPFFFCCFEFHVRFDPFSLFSIIVALIIVETATVTKILLEK